LEEKTTLKQGEDTMRKMRSKHGITNPSSMITAVLTFG
jgi:hypothetical protein